MMGAAPSPPRVNEEERKLKLHKQEATRLQEEG